jgi:hypothetical protein
VWQPYAGRTTTVATQAQNYQPQTMERNMGWKSWKTEVIADHTGKWCGNALRFATKEEAEAYVRDLAYRWTLVTDTRVNESTAPRN